MRNKKIIDDFITEETDYLKKNTPEIIEEQLNDSMDRESLFDKKIKLSIDFEAKKALFNGWLKHKREQTHYELFNELERLFFDESLRLFSERGIKMDRAKELFENITLCFKRKFEMKKYYSSSSSSFTRIDLADVDILQIASHYMKLPKNVNKNILCPFHTEKTPSFRFYQKTNSFHCFGCRASGNVLNFIALSEGITTKEAMKKLAILPK